MEYISYISESDCRHHYGPNSSQNLENRAHALRLELHKHESTAGMDLFLRNREGRIERE
jgi:hypothetical protein